MALKRSIDALVVGAGPVGLTAALALARHQKRHVEIIDEGERETGLSYALALHETALGALEELGVGAALRARGNRVERVAIYDGATRRAELPLATIDPAHPFLLVLPQSEIEAILLDALARAGVSVRWSHRLRRFDEGPAAVSCVIDRLDAESSGYAVSTIERVIGKTFEREIPLVIGADGYGSLVRRQLNIELRTTGQAGTIAVFELDGEPLPADVAADAARREMRITIVEGLRSLWWPLPGNRTRLSFELSADEHAHGGREKSRLPSIVPWLAHTFDASRLQGLVSARLPWHPPPSGRLMWSTAVRFERALAESFGRSRVWLAGDAAHLAFPFGVQSMNEGIVEARDLANRCGRVLDGTEGLGSLAAYGGERLARWQARITAESTAPAGTVEPWVAAHARDIVEALPVASDQPSHLLARVVMTKS